MQGRIKKVRWWQRYLDRDVRLAMRRVQETKQYQTVDYTDSGVAITMPVEIADQWDAMPHEVRAEFMAAVEAQIKAGGDASGTHEWSG